MCDVFGTASTNKPQLLISLKSLLSGVSIRVPNTFTKELGYQKGLTGSYVRIGVMLA